MKYEAEICYKEAVYEANFSCGIEIGINFQNQSKSMTSSFRRQ